MAIPNNVDSATLQAQAREKIDAAKEAAGTSQIKKRYYSRYKGTRFCFPDGEIALFSFDGKVSFYETDVVFHIKELDKAIAVNGTSILSLTPVPVRVNDAQFLRDVGSQTSAGGGVGAVSSQNLEQLAALSGS